MERHRPEPGAEPAPEHRDVLMAVVPQQPPEPSRPAGPAVVVGDHEHALADSRPARRGREVLIPRKRVTPLPFDRQIRKLRAEERGARDVRLEVELPTRLPAIELVGAVDEPVDQ